MSILDLISKCYTSVMKTIIRFTIQKGKKCYTAYGLELPVVTQAKTLDELTSNIKRAVDLHLEGEDLAELGLVKKPTVLVDYEIPQVSYA